MKLEDIKQMVHDVIAQGKTPHTLILTTEDADSLKLPPWTKQFLGMKVVIAANWPRSEVTSKMYESVTLRKTDPKDLKEYQEAKGIINQ